MRVPGGVASCLGVGRPGSGALPPPTARPLGGLPGPTIHWLWVRGGAGVGNRHQPHSARFCQLALRAVGAEIGCPGGAPLAWAWGVRGRALSHPQLPALWAGCRGPLPTGCGCGGVRGWGRVTNPTACALASWLCALWGRHEGARGGRLLRGCGASGVGRSPTPDCPPSGRAAGTHYPLAVGAGGCGRGDPSPAPQRALLRAGLARCGGGMRVPGGVASCLGVGRPGSGALPPPTARPLGGLPGPTIHWLWVRGGAGVGNRHQPHSARFCQLALRAVGAEIGCPGGAPLAWAWGVRGRAFSHPQLPALWAGCRGPLPTGCGCGGPRGWGPVTNPTARALASWLCALWGRHEGAREGRFLRGCGASGVGRSPTPNCPPSGRAAGDHYPLAVDAGGCGRGDPSPTPQRALLRAGFARCGGGTRAPGGGRLLPGCGASGVGRSPTPDCPPSGRAAGAHYPLAVGAGGYGRGDPSPTPQRALLRAGFARCGGGMRVPGGAPLAWVWGVRGWALSHPRLPALQAGCRGPLPTGCGCGGVRAWGLVTNLTARALARWLCALWDGTRAPGGGRLLPGCGASGVGRFPNPNCPPSGRAAGAPYPLAVGAGRCGRGDPSQTPQHALLRAGFARCGSGMRVPGEAPLAWRCGVRGRALSHPRLPALWAGCRGPLPTGCGCGGVRAWGPVTNPTARALGSWLCTLWGRHEGALGGASCLGVGRPGSGALPPPTARPLGGLPGPTTHWLWVRGGAGVGTRHQPHSVRSCELALRAVGAA